MFIDKTIAKARVSAHGKTPRQIEEIEQQSIDHIRSISQDLMSLMDELSQIDPSMTSPNASPINVKHKNHPSSRNSSQQQELLAHSFFKSGNTQQSQQSPSRPHKKASVPAVHYASYMNPTRHVKQKIREILIEEREHQLEAQERERRKVEQLKRKANKNYALVESRYQKFHDKKVEKIEAVANRQIEKEFQQMSGVTFKPTINKNISINESFEQRLESNKHKRSVKEGEVIKDMIRGHTYKPKINAHKVSESKIKQIWSPCNSDVKSNLSKTQPLKFFTDSLNSSPGRQARSSCVRADARDFQFMISQSMFES